MHSEILRHFYNRQAVSCDLRLKICKKCLYEAKKRWAKFSLGINLMLISNRLKKFEKKSSYKSYWPKMFAHSNQTKKLLCSHELSCEFPTDSKSPSISVFFDTHIEIGQK
jgi:hypothetical protein